MLATMLSQGCQHSTNNETGNETAKTDSLSEVLQGDSTVYGLACDGCTDTILVFLPLNDITADPDTFNILSATRNHRILGHPTVGERIAVVRNATDSTKADFVIVMDDLYGSWCYQVLPTLKESAGMAGLSKKQQLKVIPDSIKEALKVAREYGMQLNGDHSARAIGMIRPNEQKDEEQIIIYPKVKRYREWKLYNGKLLLREMGLDSTGNQHVVATDTAEFMLMAKDSLVLRFGDTLREYYRKKGE